MTPRFTVTRKFTFAAGHRVLHHESVCKHPHGHNYEVYATFSNNDRLDSLGRVIDFGEIKKRLGEWLENNFDHAFLVYAIDGLMIEFLDVNDFKYYVLPYNPTAENIAKFLLLEVCPQLFNNVICTKVKVQETPNCSATYKIPL